MRFTQLDKSRPYGETHPAGGDEHGSHYSQNGLPYDQDGKLLTAKLTKAQHAIINAPPEAQKGKKAAPALTDAQIAALEKANLLTPEQKAEFKKPVAAAEDPADKKPFADVNLSEWLRDQGSTDFNAVRLATKALHHKWITSKVDLVEFLVHEVKLCTVDDLDPDLRKLLTPRQDAA